MKKYFFQIAAIALCIAMPALAAHAQNEADAQQELRVRVDKVIQSAMDAIQANTVEFNDEIAKMNEVRPLELQNLDSAHVATNMAVSVQFLEFLKHAQIEEDSLSRVLEDSVYAIQQSMPPGVEENALNAFGESHSGDRKAFDGYIGSLSKLYSQVLDVLSFLHHTNYRVGKTGLEIASKEDAAQYTKLMKAIDATSAELQKASQESQKATALANKKIAEFNAAQNAAVNGKNKSTKKKPAKK